MSRRSVILVPLMSGVLICAFIWSGLKRAAALPERGLEKGAMALQRAEDPLIVEGADLPVFEGQPIDELILYAFDEGTWSPVPFQIDERTNDITGTYVVFEDGLLDANDEVVFMAKDAGGDAGDSWPDDAQARLNPRYILTASDPLNPGDQGWAYLYRSTTLTTSPTAYVDWDEPLQSITAISYTAAFNPESFVGLADLTVNGNGVDILDRQKTRIQALIFEFDEEDLINYITPTISIPVVGAVRGVANGSAFNVSIYGAKLEFKVEIDADAFPLPLDQLRASFDLNDPAVTGINNFYDSNGSAVAIDGLPDAVNTSPRFQWYQASGPSGGLVAAFPSASVISGTITNYYKDDSTFDPDDTGDGLSYGDSGLVIDSPEGLVQLHIAFYVLPPGATANVGASYFDRATTPLMVTTEIQYIEGGKIYLPFILKPVPSETSQ